MPETGSDLARRLADRCEAVCRHYLSKGRRKGRYWLVGDVHNATGRSLFVRLEGAESERNTAGKWTDAATGEHGDLLDIIRKRGGLIDFRDVADEARRFLSLPQPAFEPRSRIARRSTPSSGLADAARRLFAMSQPIGRTLGETYLRSRNLTALHDTEALRFHPRCYHRPDEDSPTETWPAMVARITDLSGRITGAHRTWIMHDGSDKAPLETPRRAMGNLLGHAVRFGVAHDVLAAGEGIETMLSLRCILPRLPMAAALSAAHLSAILFPPTLRRLYIARDNDQAGGAAVETLIARAQANGIETLVLSPQRGDFNEDLRRFEIDTLRATVRNQIAPDDVARFIKDPLMI